MLAVPAAAAALLHPVAAGLNQRRLLQHAGYSCKPLGSQRRGIDGDAVFDQAALAVVDVEHLAGIGPEIVDRGLRAAMAFLGAVAEPHHPFRRMP